MNACMQEKEFGDKGVLLRLEVAGRRPERRRRRSCMGVVKVNVKSVGEERGGEGCTEAADWLRGRAERSGTWQERLVHEYKM